MTAEENSDFVRRLREEWDSFPPALQASSEGKTAGLNLLLTNATKIARVMREELGAEVDPSAEASLLVVLCANAFRVTISPEPSSEICQVLAAAAIRIMALEDDLDVAKAELEILRD
jgi:hypothetical protein